jgi:hypothetical protein
MQAMKFFFRFSLRLLALTCIAMLNACVPQSQVEGESLGIDPLPRDNVIGGGDGQGFGGIRKRPIRCTLDPAFWGKATPMQISLQRFEDGKTILHWTVDPSIEEKIDGFVVETSMVRDEDDSSGWTILDSTLEASDRSLGLDPEEAQPLSEFRMFAYSKTQCSNLSNVVTIEILAQPQSFEPDSQ